MLVVARDYKAAYDSITGSRTLELRKYELKDHEWAIVDDLIYVLKVGSLFDGNIFADRL